ncbi:11213_t:CDS:2 [Funneliformis geosporum]|uniref:6546_t:CDS:1 n=1 Tax=Funneliformis geosporum TaxID=1117311 RepID=A0A9W4SNU9_9GLOM|nr:11213_t:CDS:2 [Funneliformis geosporum]CAI2175901.1 6546_t:CDS:2 [Funneliformis geosporum]
MEPTPTSTQEEILAGDNPLNYNTTSNQYGSNSFSTPTRPSVRCPALTVFLHQLNLSQYHSLFVEAGVGENDLEQLLGFDEAELKEVMSAISMKPFHSAAFKKGIRELRQNFSPMLSSGHSYQSIPLTYPNVQPTMPVSPVEFQTGSMSPTRKLVKIAPAGEKTPTYLDNKPTKPAKMQPPFLHNTVQPMQEDQDVFMEHEQTPQDILSTPTNIILSESSNSLPINNSTTSKDVIIHHATIYGKNSPRQLTSYEQAINCAAIELALQDPALVANKGMLFEKAKEKLLREGYSYKRGASRSKLNPNAPKPGSRASRATLRAKRNAHAAQNSEHRNARIAELERKLKVKETQYEMAIEVVRSKSTQKDSDKAQIALEELEKEKIEMGKELATLKSKERKHRWYEQKKKERMDSGFDESVEESFNDDNNNDEPKDNVKLENSIIEAEE